MQFPAFQFPYVGHGMTIGLNAVIHVFLSHGVAIGLFAAIVMAEALGFWRKSEAWDRFAHKAIIPTAITISSVSAITGVGIWFTIGPLAPRASSSMLRIFFWPWFLEWIDFVLEVVILLVYYLLWTPMSTTRRRKIGHIFIGVFYPISAFVSAFLITGIIGYMLTPSYWPYEQTRWSAFANASLWPQTFLRFFGGLSLGMLLAMGLVVLLEKERPFRRAAFRFYSLMFLLFSGATAISTTAYFHIVPAAAKAKMPFAILTSHASQYPGLFWAFLWIGVAVFIAIGLLGLLGTVSAVKWSLIPTLLVAFLFTAGYERIREFIRGPYVMTSYLYTNNALTSEQPRFERTGVLPRLYWYQVQSHAGGLEQAGRALFGQNCATCHTSGGINNIGDRVRGRTLQGIDVIVAHTNEMVPWMPPFAGTSQERAVLASYLYDLSRGAALGKTPHLFAPAERDIP